MFLWAIEIFCSAMAIPLWPTSTKELVMTDVQVTPVPTEAEMAQIRGIFARAADSIVAASELGHRVAELTKEVEGLRRDVEWLRSTNQRLNDQLIEVRGERDVARSKAVDLQHELNEANAAIGVHANTISSQRETISYRNETIARLNRESDDHLLRAMGAEEELGKVKAKLAEASAWMEEVQAMLRPKVETVDPTPVQAPEPWAQSGPMPEPVPSMVQEEPEPQPEVAPTRFGFGG